MVVYRNVAGVDLDDVVYEQHRDDMGDVDRSEERRQRERHRRDVPRVFGAVLEPQSARDVGAPFNCAQGIEFGDESDASGHVVAARALRHERQCVLVLHQQMLARDCRDTPSPRGVEAMGIEPTTSCMPCKRSTN